MVILGLAWLFFKRRRSGEKSDPRIPLIRGELALAREEAAHAKVLRRGHPLDGVLVDEAWPDWRAKTAYYAGTALGRSAQAKFAPDADLDADIALLDSLAEGLDAKNIEADEATLEDAARARRENEAASLFSYSDAPQ